MPLSRLPYEIFQSDGKTYERNHNGEWFACDFFVQTVGSNLSKILEQEYQEMKNCKPKKANEFIAVISESFGTKSQIECNYIDTNENQTLIFGIIENSSNFYDVLIAAIPSSKKVTLKPKK